MAGRTSLPLAALRPLFRIRRRFRFRFRSDFSSGLDSLLESDPDCLNSESGETVVIQFGLNTASLFSFASRFNERNWEAWSPANRFNGLGLRPLAADKPLKWLNKSLEFPSRG